MKTRLLGMIVSLAAGSTAQVGGGPVFRVGGAVQPAQPAQFQFQQAGTLSVAGGRTITLYVNNDLSASVVTGRPFSATEVRSSLQTLGDGTEISSSSSTVIYRDSLGRVREQPDSPNPLMAAVGIKRPGSIMITDPVSRFTITLNPGNMVARKTPLTTGELRSSVADLNARLAEANAGTAWRQTTATAPPAGRGGRGGRGGAAVEDTVIDEDLGPQSMNGVVATGTRHTLIIPQGTIGNNRDIHVVNERWYSPDLQMLVKTVNSDPRFGTDTYELSEISRDDPDPALFQIPAGYTVMDGAGRGRAVQVTIPPVNK